jgi:hypothetical protein
MEGVSTSAPFLTSLNAGTEEDSVVSSNTATQAWPTIPVEDDPTPADTSGFSLVSDLADMARPVPGVQPTSDAAASTAASFGRDVAFDWSTGEPYGLVSGNLQYAIDDAEVLGWVAKALYTPQAEYVIYSTDYGSTLRELVGEGGDEGILQSEIARTTQEVISAHPRISDARVLAVYRNPALAANAYFIVCSITLDSGTDPLAVTFIST